MSTADSYLIVSVQTCVHDIYKVFHPNIPEKKELRLTRVFAIVLPLGALVIALYIKNAYNILMFAWSFYAAAAGLPAFAALYWKKATKAGIISGMAAGFTVCVGWKLAGTPFGLGPTVPGAIACAAALVIVSLATYKKPPPASSTRMRRRRESRRRSRHNRTSICVLATRKGVDTMPKKRANGEGSLRKRKNGRWEGRYTAGYDPATGKPIHKSVLAKTQSEAKEKLKQAIAEAEKLDMSRAKSYTLGAWIKLWYEVYAEPRLREKTKDYCLNYINNHIIPELGNTPLEKLTTIQIQKFYNDLQKSGRIQRYTHIKLKDKGLSTRAVLGIHTLLNNCLEQAVAERLLLTNPAKGCRLPKLKKREMKILPEDKIGPYLAEAERHGLLAAFYLELTTGLRRGELLALLWTDLDVENMTISVSKQVNRINGELVVSQPKTSNSIRKLAIPQRAVELLVEEHAKHPTVLTCSYRPRPAPCLTRIPSVTPIRRS